MRRHAIWLATVAAVAWAPVRAAADTLDATYQAEAAESSHRVRVSVSGDTARFTVTRVLRNLGTGPDEIQLVARMPSAAVAHAFRHRLGGRWMRGVLMNASKAEARYDELTGAGDPRRLGPALLSYSDAGELALRVYPVPRGGAVTVEYRLEAPLCYRNGYYITDYPAVEADHDRLARPALALPAAARVLDAAAMRRLFPDVAPEELCRGIGHRLDDPASFIVLPAPRRRGPARALLAHHAVDEGHHLVQLDLAVPRIIEPAPRRAHVVFVIDASHSMGTAGVETQLELAAGYVAHVPDAAVEVVVVRRRAHRLFGRFVAASELARAVAAVHPHRVAPGNGSHFERGLALASSALAGARGPARVVAFTDNRLRAGFDPTVATRAAAALPASAVLHVVDLAGSRGNYSWDRDDEHDLVDVARARGGVVASMHGGAGGADSAREAMLGLVRPLSIDLVEVAVPGLGDEHDVPGVLFGGDGFRDTWMLSRAPVGAAVTGLIWGRRWRAELSPDAARSARLPRRAFGHAVAAAIPEARVYDLAMAAGAVTSATSMLSRDPAAPPTSHQVNGLIGRSYTCGAICGGVHTSSITCRAGVGGVRVNVPEPDRNAILAALLADGARTCAGPTPRAIAVSVEVTGHEIVDVAVTAPSSQEAACLTEAAWNLALPPEIYTHNSATYVASFD